MSDIMKKKNSKIVIELKNVKKTYMMGEVPVHALRGIDLKIKEGEFLAIIGPSGSGKSTLLNMVGSLDVPTTGSVKLSGVDISTLSESDLAQLRGKRIGFVFQMFNLIPSLTALENVILPLTFQGIDEDEKRERAIKVMKQLGIEKRMSHRPSELSGGERQRVAIARALVIDPKVILADEPTGNLDYHTGMEIMKILRNLQEKEGKTLIIVTHERFIAKYANRIVKLRDGKIIKDGDKTSVNWNEIKEK